MMRRHYPTATALTAAAVLSAPARAQTPHPPSSCPASRKHYKYVHNNVMFFSHDWDDAKAHCDGTEFHGHKGGLATIRSADEQKLIAQMGIHTDTMVGGYKNANDNKWYWTGDDALFYSTDANDFPGGAQPYTHWATGQPAAFSAPEQLFIAAETLSTSHASMADVFRWAPVDSIKSSETLFGYDNTIHHPYICEYCLDDADQSSAGGPTAFEVPNVGTANVYCDRLGRVLIQRASRNQWTHSECSYGAPSAELDLDGCGWLAESTVRALAAQATSVELEDLGRGGMRSTGDLAVEALQNGAHWDGSAERLEFEEYDENDHPNSEHEWQLPSAFGGIGGFGSTPAVQADHWPNMIYNVDDATSVHWATFDAEPHAAAGFPNWVNPPTDDDIEAWNGFQASWTWLVMPADFCPAPTAEPTVPPVPTLTQPAPVDPNLNGTGGIGGNGVPTPEPVSAQVVGSSTPEPVSAQVVGSSSDDDGFNPLWLLLLLLLIPLSLVAAFLVMKSKKSGTQGKTKTATFEQENADEILVTVPEERPEEQQQQHEAEVEETAETMDL